VALELRSRDPTSNGWPTSARTPTRKWIRRSSRAATTDGGCTKGFSCTGNDPSLCNPANYLFPIFDYPHAGGRCSITGGYVYRGVRGTLPLGTYVYGDFLHRRILAWDGATKNLLIDTETTYPRSARTRRRIVCRQYQRDGEQDCPAALHLHADAVRLANPPAAAGGAVNISVTTTPGCP